MTMILSEFNIAESDDCNSDEIRSSSSVARGRGPREKFLQLGHKGYGGFHIRIPERPVLEVPYQVFNICMQDRRIDL